jgi:hypothetical protein
MLRWLTKSGLFFQLVIFAALIALFWIPAFIHPIPTVVSKNDGPLFQLLTQLLADRTLLSVSISLLFIILQGWILNQVFQQNGFFGRRKFILPIIVLFAYSWNAGFTTRVCNPQYVRARQRISHGFYGCLLHRNCFAFLPSGSVSARVCSAFADYIPGILLA